MKSFGILRTNTGLTTNVKIVVDSNYGLSLDSINSNTELSSSKFKKLEFNKSNYYDELIPYFYDGLPAEIAFDIKYDDDADSMTLNFADQYDEIYQCGARNIVNNKNYSEEYEYFAPLYVYKNKLPNSFIIFRVDGPGIGRTDSSNFKSEILSNLKTIKIFDLTKKSALGEWLNMNINENEFFPNTPFEMSFQRVEFSKWNGIEYKSGGYISKSFFLDDVIEEEKEIFEFEKFIFDGYKNNKVVFPNILNFSFLFDDTPADEYTLKKWSMNRYYGFYIDSMDKITSLSPYTPPKLKSDVIIIDGNIISSLSGYYPFVDDWMDSTPFYVEYEGNYYKVEIFEVVLEETFIPSKISTRTNAPKAPVLPRKGGNEPTTVKTGMFIDIENKLLSNTYITDEKVGGYVYKWRIISDIDLKGKENKLNKNTGKVDSDKRLIDADGNYLKIEDFDRADVWLIEIDGVYHNIIKDSIGALKLSTDYSFEFDKDFFRYFVNKTDPKYTKTIFFKVDSNNKPKVFPVWRLNFSDIKDFDTRIIDTEPSKFEYDLENEIVNTDETKLYFVDHNSNTEPKQLDDFILNDKVVNIPVSSEYTANQETFKISDGFLSPIWRKNPVYCRWVYQGSLSANDYPYVLNNSTKFESNNRTTNTFDPNPNRGERNLDYFYTVNSSSSKYLHHTLHIEKSDEYGIDRKFDFSLADYTGDSKYIGATGTSIPIDYDYFNSILNLKSAFNNGKIRKNTKKYSEFQAGDNSTPNYTIFRGIKFSLYDVNNVKIDQSGQIEIINTYTKNTFENYKFSIVLTSMDNGMQWDIIDRWKMDTAYKEGDIVIHDDILYVAVRDTICDSPSVIRISKSGTGIIQNYLRPAPYNLLTYDLTDSSELSKLRFIDSNESPSLFDKNFSKTGSDWKVYEPNDENAVEIEGSIFWSPLIDIRDGYKKDMIVYNTGNYYRFYEKGTINFWNPISALSIRISEDGTSNRHGYPKDSIVIHDNKFYQSLSDYNLRTPENSKYWKNIEYTYTNSKWKPIPIWIPNKQYGDGINKTFVVYNNTVYKSKSDTDIIPSGTIPNKSNKWLRLYSLSINTNFVYGRKDNSVILQNGELYRIVNNPNMSTLDNGINVYINHKYKNVLVNIYVNDNTIPNLKNSNRDIIYKSLNKKLTAKIFIDCLNNITLRHGFSDYIKYTIIDENGVRNTYGYGNSKMLEKLKNLPHILLAERPESINVKVDSLEIIPINDSKIKPSKLLIDGRITDPIQNNYFNNTHLGVEIIQTNETPSVIKNYSGMNSFTENVLFRFSGNYMPLFSDIELFNTDNSIEFNRIDLMFEISNIQNVIFNFDVNGNKIDKVYELYPGGSFSQSFDYYSQIIPILNENLPGIEFNYKIDDKNKNIISDEVLDLDDSSFNLKESIWYDMSHNEGSAYIISSTASPIYRKSNLYPGNYFDFFGSANTKSLIITKIKNDNILTFEFFIKFSDVNSISSFCGNGVVEFGIQNGRIYMMNTFEDNTKNAVYTESVIESNVWYHLVFTRSYNTAETKCEIYIDGRFANATIAPTGLNYNSMNYGNKNGVYDKKYSINNNNIVLYSIGASNPEIEDDNIPLKNIYYTFTGSISSVRLFKKVLNDSEILNNFISEHKTFSIKYRSSEGNIKMELNTDMPKLILNTEDDPNLGYFNLQISATGGNPPYEYSYNGSAYSQSNIYYPTITKGGNVYVIVKDLIGLTASIGYYTINYDYSIQYPFNGPFVY